MCPELFYVLNTQIFDINLSIISFYKCIFIKKIVNINKNLTVCIAGPLPIYEYYLFLL